MSPKLIILPTGRLSDELLLRRVLPDPTSGTIVGPIQRSVLDPLSSKGQPIIDGPIARYFHLLSGEFLRKVKSHDPSEEEDWILDPDAPSVSTNQVSLISHTYQSISIDLRSPTEAQYTVGFKSSRGAISQTIGIDTQNFGVSTYFYSFQIPCINFANLFNMALLLSTVIYSSETYEKNLQLGKLHFNQHGFTVPLEFNEEIRAIEQPPVEPDEKTSFTVTSTESAFKASWSSYRHPVVEIESSPKPGTSKWMLNMVLNRSPHSPNRLMPLQDGLLKLWKRIEEDISQNGTSSPIKKS